MAALVAAGLVIGCGDGGTGSRTTVSASQLTGVYDVALDDIGAAASAATATIIGTVQGTPAGDLSITLFLAPFTSIFANGQLGAGGTVHLEGGETREDEVIEVTGEASASVEGEVLRIIGSVDQMVVFGGQTMLVPGGRTTFTMERPTTASAQALSGHYLFTFPRSAACGCNSTAVVELTVAADGTGSSAATTETDASGMTIATFDAGSLVISPRGLFSLRARYRSMLADIQDAIVLTGELRTDSEVTAAGGYQFQDVFGPPPPNSGAWTAARLAAAP